ARQLFLREWTVERERLLKDARLLEDDDEQGQVIVYAHQLEPAQARLGRARGCDDRGVLKAAGEDCGAETRPLLELARRLVKLVADHLPEVVGDEFFAHERLDIVAVAEVRRHAACGSMRLRDVALVLERGHFIANGGG